MYPHPTHGGSEGLYCESSARYLISPHVFVQPPGSRGRQVGRLQSAVVLSATNTRSLRWRKESAPIWRCRR